MAMHLLVLPRCSQGIPVIRAELVNTIAWHAYKYCHPSKWLQVHVSSIASTRVFLCRCSRVFLSLTRVSFDSNVGSASLVHMSVWYSLVNFCLIGAVHSLDGWSDGVTLHREIVYPCMESCSQTYQIGYALHVGTKNSQACQLLNSLYWERLFFNSIPSFGVISELMTCTGRSVNQNFWKILEELSMLNQASMQAFTLYCITYSYGTWSGSVHVCL